jgi:hypothetical protein
MASFNIWEYLWWPAALVLLVGSMAFDAYVVDKMEDLDRVMPRNGGLPRTPYFASVAQSISKWWPVQLVPLYAALLLMMVLAPLWLTALLAVPAFGWTYLILRGLQWRLNSTTVFRREPRTNLRLLATYAAFAKLFVCAILVFWGVSVPFWYLSGAGITWSRFMQGSVGAVAAQTLGQAW